MECYYCKKISIVDTNYPMQIAEFALGTSAPRCALHWRYICGICGNAAHFMSMAYCPEHAAYFCDVCAPETQIINQPFQAWQYYSQYRSPWTGAWHPALDRLDFETRHPARLEINAKIKVRGLDYNTSIIKDRLPQQWCEFPSFNDDAVKEAWNRNSNNWDINYDDDGDVTRKYFTDNVLHHMLGDVENKDIIDLGCGNGYLSRTLLNKNANVTGVDISDGMLDKAKNHNGSIKYVKSSISNLECFSDKSFNIAVSNFVLQDVPDYERALHEIYRILKPGGYLVLVISHPCFSCGPRQWYSDALDNPRTEDALFFAVDHYFREGAYILDDWKGFSPVPYFHRTLSMYWRAFRDVGFRVDDFDEPCLNDRGNIEFSELQAQQANRVPIACIFRLSKIK